MNKIGFSDEVINTFSNEIEKYKNPKDFLWVLGLIITGSACVIYASKGNFDTSAWLYNLLCFISITTILAAIIILLVNKKGFRTSKTKSKVTYYAAYCANDGEKKLTEAVNNEDWDSLKGIISEVETGLRFDIIISQDRKFCACRPMRYIPFDFQPIADFKTLSEESANKLMNLLNNK